MPTTLYEEDASLALRELVQEVSLCRDFCATALNTCMADPRRRYSLQASDLESLFKSLSALVAKFESLCSTLYEKQDADLEAPGNASTIIPG